MQDSYATLYWFLYWFWEKNRLFSSLGKKCTFIWVSLYTESTNWGQYFLGLHLETGTPFNVIWAMQKSTRLHCNGSIPSFLSYFKTLSIGPVPGIEPATSRSAVKHFTNCELILLWNNFECPFMEELQGKIHLISYNFMGKHSFCTASFQCLAKSLQSVQWKISQKSHLPSKESWHYQYETSLWHPFQQKYWPANRKKSFKSKCSLICWTTLSKYRCRRNFITLKKWLAKRL